MTNAAKQLQMSRNTLYRKLKRHGISPESLREDSLYQRWDSPEREARWHRRTA